MSDDLYRKIAAEIEIQQWEPALWARALAESDGNADRAKTLYALLRHAQLSADAAKAVPSDKGESASSNQAEARPQMSEMDRIRSALNKQLTKTGKSSLYTAIGVSPKCSTEAIAEAVASIRAREAAGETLGSEVKYAIETLYEPQTREAYDRKLLALLVRQAEADLEPIIGPDTDHSVTSGSLLGRKVSVGSAVLASLVFFGLFVVFSGGKSKPNSAPILTGGESSQAGATDPLRTEADNAPGRRVVPASGRIADYDGQEAIRRERVQHQAAYEQSKYYAAQAETQRAREEEQNKQRALREQRQAADLAERERLKQEMEGKYASAEAKRQLCISGRQRNNAGEVARWCN